MVDTAISGVVFESTIEQSLSFTAQRLNVVLVGIRGAGRSAILDRLVARFDAEDRPVLRVDGIAAWRHEPFGALMALGEEFDVQRRSLRDVTSALRRSAAEPGSILVCDDADDLDLQTAGALAHLQRRGGLVTVFSRRPGSGPTPLGMSHTMRIQVPSLSLSQFADLAASVLDGPMETRSLSRLAALSGGLYGVSLAMLTAGRVEGLITQGPTGQWTATGEFWCDPLAGSLAPLVTDLEPELLEAITLMAASGPVPLDEAVGRIGRSQLSRLFALGLARRVLYGSDTLVSLFPPILADYLSAQPSSLIFPPHAGSQGLLSTGTAAIVGNRIAQEAGARVLRSRQAWEADPAPAQAVALIAALRDAMEPAAEVDRVVESTPILGDDFASAFFAIQRARWQVARGVELDTVIAELRAVRAQVPGQDGLLRAGEAHLAFMHSHPMDTELLAAPAPGADPVNDAALQAVRVEIQLARGMTASASELLVDYQPDQESLRTFGVACRDLRDVLAGELDKGVQSALRHLEEGRQYLSIELTEVFGYVALLGLLLSGRLHDGARLMEDRLSTTPSWTVHGHYHSGFLALGALISLWQGRSTYARALGQQANEHPAPGPGPYPGMVPEVVLAILHSGVANASPEDALWQLIDARLDTGLVVDALLSAVLAVEYRSDPVRVRRTSRAAAACESPLMQAIGRYITAVDARDVTAIAASIEDFTCLGARILAVRGSVVRALLLRDAGLAEEAAAQAAAAWDLATPAGPERWGLFVPLVDAVGLSKREYSVMDLLATGMPTPEVAATLGMGVRTVETHLHNVARKVGVSGKENLVRAVRTWLRPAG